ncbi:MAG: sigma-54-dependent Fis family transcriptional regulator, partial [Proteobacteria bacterium]
GESGTGKELVARMIHDTGPMAGKPFIPVNCGAIPENLIESEMFGHKKGSFTGAVSDKPGLFEAANGGTLFLDEVGELPLSMQVKLLRALQERIVRRVGANDDIKVDVRIISATNRDLDKMIKENRFREDLFYRLNVILIKTPPLRDRGSDIPMLANEFLKRFVARQGKEIHHFSDDAMDALVGYSWPGNIRELENVIERAVTLEGKSQIEVTNFPALMLSERAIRTASGNAVQNDKTREVETLFKDSANSEVGRSLGQQKPIELPAPDYSRGPIDLDSILAAVEKQYIEKALEHTNGVKKRAAEVLGITFRSIRYRLTKLGMDEGDES